MEQREIERKLVEIKNKERDLEDRMKERDETQDLLNQYSKFPNFLDEVVKQDENFIDKTDLQNRFKSLKNENNMLIRQVSARKTDVH